MDKIPLELLERVLWFVVPAVPLPPRSKERTPHVRFMLGLLRVNRAFKLRAGTQ